MLLVNVSRWEPFLKGIYRYDSNKNEMLTSKTVTTETGFAIQGIYTIQSSVKANKDHLDISTVGRHEILVDERAGLAYSGLRWVYTASASDLQCITAKSVKSVLCSTGDILLCNNLLALNFKQFFFFGQLKSRQF